MATRKTETRQPMPRQPVELESDSPSKKDAEVLHSRLQSTDDPLTLDDSDFGGDPYNRSGRFTTLNPDKDR